MGHIHMMVKAIANNMAPKLPQRNGLLFGVNSMANKTNKHRHRVPIAAKKGPIVGMIAAAAIIVTER